MNIGVALAVIESQPWTVVLAALIGVAGTLATTYRPNRTQEAQVAINGLKELTVALQGEVSRLNLRVASLGFRVGTLEGKLREAGLPVPPSEEVT